MKRLNQGFFEEKRRKGGGVECRQKKKGVHIKYERSAKPQRGGGTTDSIIKGYSPFSETVGKKKPALQGKTAERERRGKSLDTVCEEKKSPPRGKKGWKVV